jgi:hypothetical protein
VSITFKMLWWYFACFIIGEILWTGLGAAFPSMALKEPLVVRLLDDGVIAIWLGLITFGEWLSRKMETKETTSAA